MRATVKLLGSAGAAQLGQVAEDVFDHPVDARWTVEFLADPRHHIVVAVVDGQVVGMATGVHYKHPDQAPQLFVNEVGVAPAHQRRGIGRRMVDALLAHGRAIGCVEAWVGTAPDNVAARALHAAAGGEESPEPFVMVSFRLAP